MTSLQEERRQRQREAPPTSYDADLRRVMTLATFLERNSLSAPTFRRMRLAGLGPRVVQLGLRRLGITYLAEREWQDSRSSE
jgi:hypothetical protein